MLHVVHFFSLCFINVFVLLQVAEPLVNFLPGCRSRLATHRFQPTPWCIWL